jgi:hypothetical protein
MLGKHCATEPHSQPNMGCFFDASDPGTSVPWHSLICSLAFCSFTYLRSITIRKYQWKVPEISNSKVLNLHTTLRHPFASVSTLHILPTC